MFYGLLKGIYYYSEEQRLLAEEGLPTWVFRVLPLFCASGDQGPLPGGHKESQCCVGPPLGPVKLRIGRMEASDLQGSISTEIEPAPTFYYAEA